MIPLLTQSASTLLQRAPPGHESMVQDALEHVRIKTLLLCVSCLSALCVTALSASSSLVTPLIPHFPQVSSIAGVKRVSHVHVWALKQGKHVATIHLLVDPHADEQVRRRSTTGLVSGMSESVRVGGSGQREGE